MRHKARASTDLPLGRFFARRWSRRRFSSARDWVLYCDTLWRGLPSAPSALGYPFAPALVAGSRFVMTSTTIVMQMLKKRGDISAPKRSVNLVDSAA